MTDDPVVAQLRAWADDLADQIPPVATPTGERVATGRRAGRVLALAAAVLVVLAVVGVAVGTRSGGDEDVRTDTTSSTTTVTSTTVAPVVDLPLEGTSWWLEGLAVDGVPRDVPLSFVARIGVGRSDCPPEPWCHPPAGTLVLGGYDGCNGFSGEVTIGDDTITGHGITSELVGCIGVRNELANLVKLGAGDARYTIDGDVLVIRSGDVEATYRAGADGYPAVPGGGGVMAEGPAEAPYRATWGPVEVAGGPAIRVRVVRPEDIPPSAAGIDLALPATGQMAAAAAVGGPESVLVGVVDARATLVTYRWGGTVVEVPTVALAGRSDVRGFAALVDGATMGWRLSATAADGTEVATFVHRP